MIDFRKLRTSGAKPRVHGNGFIQVDLSERERLHIWGDRRIPKQKVATPIHDHVFGFRSTLIVGRLLNITYAVSPSFKDRKRYEIYEAACREGEDTILQPTGQVVGARIAYAEAMERGDSYDFSAAMFHESFPTEPSASVMTKDGPTLAQGAAVAPRILVPVGQEPDNDFNRYTCASEELLWRIIETTLQRQ